MVWCETGTPDLAFAKKFAEGIRTQVPGEDAGLQLLAVVQLEAQPRRRDHRQIPARARRDGLQVPVHHAGRLPLAQLLDVRARARLRAQRHERLRRAAAEGVRRRREGLHRGQAPARGRHRLLRRDHPGRAPAARRRPPRCTARPRTSNSSTRRKSRSSPRRRFRRPGRARDPGGLRPPLPPVPRRGGRGRRLVRARRLAAAAIARARAHPDVRQARRGGGRRAARPLPRGRTRRDAVVGHQARLHRPAARAPAAGVRRDLLQLGRLPGAAPALLPQRLHLLAPGGGHRAPRGRGAELPLLLPLAARLARHACARSAPASICRIAGRTRSAICAT